MWLMNMQIIVQIFLMILLVITAVIDIKKREIPAALIALGASLATAYVVYSFVNEAGCAKVVPALLPGAAMLLISLVTRGEVGLGDGLMLLFIGPVFGLEQTVAGLLIALFISSIFSIVVLALKKGNRKTKLAFIPFLTLGMGAAMLCVNFQVI